MSSAIFRAERFFVPLNNMCSIKCVIPLFFLASSRDPTLNQKPRENDWMWEIFSVIILIPLGSIVFLKEFNCSAYLFEKNKYRETALRNQGMLFGEISALP